MKRMIILLSVLMFFISACDEEDVGVSDGSVNVVFPITPSSGDNPPTEAGLQLGRMLFYEKKLSRTNEVACASCHHQELAFSDNNRVSFGVDSLMGDRQAMALFNLPFTENGFFWDGRTDVLRHLTLQPIENEIEMDETLGNVISKLSDEAIYRNQFELAFGNEEITEGKIALALEQFLASLISDNSKYDQHQKGEIELTLNERQGEALFISLGCTNCHSSFNFDDVANRFLNNGLDVPGQFGGLGRELVTGSPADRAQFKVTSLRNIGVTAPYMHDGRFNTLEEVIDHYASEVKQSPTVAGEVLGGFDISDSQKSNLVDFLNTLTDEEFLTNPDFSDPF